ncbi:hypothetical protein L9F63_016087, partial [Diploptera punctata]
MNQKHLGNDSVIPNFTAGLVVLYSMRFCPYGQRVQMVLEAKKIPYDVVYINLMDKPSWYLERNPLGKVPSLEKNPGKCIYESLIVADYLDEEYPQTPLHSKDPMQKAKDRILVEQFSKVIQDMYKLYQNISKETFQNLLTELDCFEKELISRQTFFFGGNSPGMLDYMIWPWFERIGLLKCIGGNGFGLFEDRFPELIAWRDRMKDDDPVKVTYLEPDIHARFIESRKSGKPDFDLCFKKMSPPNQYLVSQYLNIDY